MLRIRYTPEEKENVLRLCDEIGVPKASEQTGISAHSLYKWPTGTEAETSAAITEYDAIPIDETIVEEKDVGPSPENATSLRKRYTAEEKVNALRLCDEIGITKASKETGITYNTLHKWRADAQNETVITTIAAVGTPIQEVAMEQKDSQSDERTAVIARHTIAPVKEMVTEEKAPRSNHDTDVDAQTTNADVTIEKLGKQEEPHPGVREVKTDKATSEELIRLRIENSTLKAQMLVLKSALRVFTE